MKIRLLAMLCLTLVLSLSACGQADQGASDVASADDGTAAVGMGNPWTESDCQGVLEATGLELLTPEGASDVYYQYMESDQMAEVSYQLDGAEWTYRAQPSSELLDISGMYYEWALEEEGTVTGRTATYYSYVSDDENDVMVVEWFDAVPGITYSLSASAEELNGMDIQVYAENIFVPVQGDSDGN